MSLARSVEGAYRGSGLVAAVRERFGHLVHELAKFGVVGAIAYAVDLATFNALLAGPMADRPLTAKIISTVLATTVAFFGNRQWTFRHRTRQDVRREYILFFGLNAVGLGIALSCLGISHYLLGFTSPLADNLSANVVGMALGTIFRFWAYRKFVFTEVAAAEPNEEPRPQPLPA